MSASCDASRELDVVFAFKRLNPLVIPVVANTDANKPTDAASHPSVAFSGLALVAFRACVATTSRLVTNT